MKNVFLWSSYVTDPGQAFYVADLILNPGEQILPHSHDYYEFYVVLEGEFAERLNGKDTRISRGMGHILYPADDHCLYNRTQKTAMLRNIAVRADRFEGLLEETGLRMTAEHGDRSALMRAYFSLEDVSFRAYCDKSACFSRVLGSTATGQFILQSICMDILIAVLVSQRQQDAPQWLEKLRGEMEKEENFVIGLPRMKELTGCSQEYLNRAFRRFYGQTPTEFINELRLNNAAHLLLSGERPVLEIAMDCGFENLSWFNRLFKARYLMTPSEYRRRKNYFFRSI